MANIGFDFYHKYILHDETDTNIDVIEVYTKAKDEEDFPHVAMSSPIIMTAEGKADLGNSRFTGVTTFLENGWKYKCRTIPASPIIVKVSNGNTVSRIGEKFVQVANVHYEFDQSTSAAAIAVGGLSPTQQQIRDSMLLTTVGTPANNSIDKKLNDLLILDGNTQEWVSPGLLKIYENGQTIGGTTFAEFETRDSLGVQTFDVTKVRQFVRVK